MTKRQTAVDWNPHKHQWIGSSMTPLRFPELAGWDACFLTFVKRPHALLLLGVHAPHEDTKAFFRCEMCRLVNIVPEWKVSGSFVVETTEGGKRLSDVEVGIAIECGSIAALTLDEARRFASDSVFLKSVVDGF